jgi:hypothetical protein
MIRRDLLRLGGGAVLGSALAGPLLARDAAPIALYDGRYSDARRFAAAAQEHGAMAFDTKGDVATLWHDGRLGGRVSRGVTGMTGYADLLMIEDLARTAGLRVRFTLEHDARGGNLVRHRLASGRPAPSNARDVDWPAAVAGFALGAAAALPVETSVRSPDHPGTLWSWRFA